MMNIKNNNEFTIISCRLVRPFKKKKKQKKNNDQLRDRLPYNVMNFESVSAFAARTWRVNTQKKCQSFGTIYLDADGTQFHLNYSTRLQ